MIKVTAVFDIGKTNKKFFLFDANFQEVYREYTRFEMIVDEDGYETENIKALHEWLKQVFQKALNSKKYKIIAVNFSSYGASLVHLDKNGQVLTPLYNYTKPLDQKWTASFYEKYGPESEFLETTGSSTSCMLNAGMQLYWLKYAQPEVYSKIAFSLHLPQYLSYLFTGVALSEYTSIGCHTSLWDYCKEDYHEWVYKEEIHRMLPPIVSAESCLSMNFNSRRIKFGIGIHDSSASLIPYLRSIKKEFILVSTGTWSVAMNPFSKGLLSKEDIANNCINYMRISGQAVKASSLFLGNEYSLQVKLLSKKFDVAEAYHKTVQFDKTIFSNITKDFKNSFKWEGITSKNMPLQTSYTYDKFEYAYHHLMLELVLLQVESIKQAMSDNSIKKLYIDGGFSDNSVYIKLLSHFLSKMKIRTANSSLGSALGAAIVISNAKLNAKFLKKNYSLKKHTSK